MPLFVRRKESPEFYRFFRTVFGFTPRRTELYHIALTHSSSSTVEHGHRINNERLEYLGDAVLGAVVAEYLYRKYPLKGEGFLTEMRSKIVSRQSLGGIARKIGLPELVEHQRGQSGSFKSMGGDAFEAIIGAVYLEKGYRFTRRFIIDKLICTYLDIDAIAATDWNFKGKLIDWGQKNHKKVSFEVVRTLRNNPEGRREYECRVRIDNNPQLSAIGYTIKSAEQLAAEKTYKALVGTAVDTPAEEKNS